MRVLFVSYNGLAEPLMQSQGLSYLKGLSEKGVDVYLLTFEKNNSKSAIGAIKTCTDLERYNIKWKSLRYHKNLSLISTLFDIFIGVVIGLHIVFSGKIDILHARGTVPAAICYAIKFTTGKKFLFDLRGILSEEYVDGGIWKRSSFSCKLTGFFEKKFLASADHIVVLSRKIKDFLLKGYYAKACSEITVIPCCVDLSRFLPDKAARSRIREELGLGDRFVMLYSGSFGTWYMLEEMLDFFITLKDTMSNLHFLILTPEINKPLILEACARKNISLDDVTIKQSIFNEMPFYVNPSDIGAFFIKPVFSKQASCPTKFAEYLACGLPVVINSGIGDTGDIVLDNKVGVVVREFNKIAYLDAIRDLKGLMGEKNPLKNRCVDTAKRLYSLQKGTERYAKIYKDI